MAEYYTIQGVIKEICPVEKYNYTFRNLVVDGNYIHMAKGATWSRDDVQVGDEVVVTCFSESMNGETYICGISVTWLGDNKRMTSSVLTPQEFAERMKNISMSDGTEMGHANMDGLMCEVLESLGYGEGVKIFKETDKWYA